MRLCKTLEDACRLSNYSNVKPRSNLLCCACYTLFCDVNTCCMQAMSNSGVGTWLWYLQIVCCIFCLPVYFLPRVYQFCCPDPDLCPHLLWRSTWGVLLAGKKLREEWEWCIHAPGSFPARLLSLLYSSTTEHSSWKASPSLVTLPGSRTALSSPFRPINGIHPFLPLSLEPNTAPHCIFYPIITISKLPYLSVWDSHINIWHVSNACWVISMCFWYNLPKVSGKWHHSVCRFVCLFF